MISRLKNRFMRRAALVVAVPLLVPASFALEGVRAAWKDFRDWPPLIRKVWNQ